MKTWIVVLVTVIFGSVGVTKIIAYAPTAYPVLMQSWQTGEPLSKGFLLILGICFMLMILCSVGLFILALVGEEALDD